jgi:3D (Asp-Asp-Asp) domain-containing protein
LDPKSDVGIKLILVTLFMTSTLLSSLWMAGYLENESVSYTRYQHVVEAKEQPKQEVLKKEKPLVDKQLESKVRNSLEVKQNIAHEEKKTKEVYMDEFLNVIMENEKMGYTDKQDKQEVKISAMSKGSFDIAFDLERLESELELSQYPAKQVLATGYTAGYESTGKKPDHPQYGITYSGVQVRRDLYSTIAADPTVFPIGTILYIPGYGYGVVADVGGAIRGDKIDLYFENIEDVFQLWGKQKVQVYVIQQGDGILNETVLDRLNQDESILAYKAFEKEKEK